MSFNTISAYSLVVMSPYLFLCASRTSAHSAWVSLAALAVRRAPWCTSSSGSPRAGSSPPLPSRCGSPAGRSWRCGMRGTMHVEGCSWVGGSGGGVGSGTCWNTWWMAPSISERLDTRVMDWIRMSRFFCSLRMISMDWLSSSHRGVRAWW